MSRSNTQESSLWDNFFTPPIEDIDAILNNLDSEPKSFAIVDTLPSTSQATVVPDTHSPNPVWEKLSLHSSQAGSPDRTKSDSFNAQTIREHACVLKLGILLSGTIIPQRLSQTLEMIDFAPSNSIPEVRSYPPLSVVGEYVFVGYDTELQLYMNSNELSWAVQYEIIRLRSLGHYKSIDDIKASNPKALSCGDHFLESQHDLALGDNPYEELEREEQVLEASSGDHFSLRTSNLRCGGEVKQILRLVQVPEHEHNAAQSLPRIAPYTFVLEKHTIGSSNSVARMLGSRRVLEAIIPETLLRTEVQTIRHFFSRRFVFNGKVFQAVCAAGSSVFLVETGDYAPSRSALTNNGRKSLQEIVSWLHPIESAPSQNMRTWSSRLSVGFLDTIPICRIGLEDIMSISNIEPRLKPPINAGHSLLSACRYMSSALAFMIKRRLGCKVLPCAVRANVRGMYSIFISHPKIYCDRPAVFYCNDSQNRPLHTLLDDSQSYFGLVSVPKLQLGADLSPQLITRLHHRGVPVAVFLDLFRSGFNVYWSNLVCPDASSFQDRKDEGRPLLSSTSHCLASGLPMNWRETVMSLLASGFEPKTCIPLQENTHRLRHDTLSQYTKDLNIPITSSILGLAIPDPLGVLEPGQIYCRGSQKWLCNGFYTDTVVAEVVTDEDITTFTAVDCPALHSYFDIILFSAKGGRFSWHSKDGADYIGNEKSSSPRFLLFRNLYFDMNTETASQFSQRLLTLPKYMWDNEMQVFSLGSLSDVSTAKQFAYFHDLAVYMHGHNHIRTERLASIAKTCSTASVSGFTLKKDVIVDHEHRYGQYPPHFESLANDGLSRSPAVARPESLGPWVLDLLRCEGHRMQERPKHARYSGDLDLLQPFKDAQERAKENALLTAELEALMDVVRANRAKYERWGVNANDVDIKIWRQPILCDLAHSLHHTPTATAYKKPIYETKYEVNWAWEIFFRELCRIKVNKTLFKPRSQESTGQALAARLPKSE
ncbi:hypothetical protein BS47DRAFT_1390018 [Hydnum rufescens UP504]|uniref:RNA-dependent RNA polymerase n=1 Tax=Hydnum rufescens UP504 TaxID=1448309 RepID=A0A9P6B3Y1_9AGAM|nr:hypothetical protein BS47DRAFT_1390018 [Hydnum rufescens UP504]